MADIINILVALAEAKELAKADAEMTALVPRLEGQIDAELSRLGFKNVNTVKSMLALSIARIVSARKVAGDHLARLAYDAELELGSD